MKPFCIDWYVNDWIGGTLLMGRPHKGAYMDLLMAQVNNGHMSLKQIKTLLGKEDEYLWDEILCTKFKKDSEGKYYNQKIEDQVNKKKAYSESRLKNLSSHKDTHMGVHMEEEEEDIDIDIKKKREELLKKREKKFINEVRAVGYPEEMSSKFITYWTEPNKSRSKMKFELEKTWDMTRRLSTWASRDKDFDKDNLKKKEIISYTELLDKFNKGDTAIWDKYESFKKDGKTLWKLKKYSN